MGQKFLRWILGVCFFAGISLQSPQSMAAKPQASRVFLLTSTYGVLVGTLTGLASLAFYEEPGTHKRNIALGASLGLYTGILLGSYIYLLAPDPNAPRATPAVEEDDEEAQREAQPVENPERFVMGWDPSTEQVVLGLSFKF